MASLVRKYPIGKNRLAQGLLRGFKLTEGGVLEASSDGERRVLYLGSLDGVDRDCEWGRFAFGAELGQDVVTVVRAFASNEPVFLRKGVQTNFDSFLLSSQEPEDVKDILFRTAEAKVFSGTQDMLLTGLSGRYLWISVEVLGQGKAVLSNFRVYSPEDNFFNSFPEVYRTNGEFFRRYLSIFNSLYADFQETIDSLDRLIDVDTAPAPLLCIFARWLGLELDGNFLEEEQLRRLVKTAFSLISAKGTRRAVEGVVHALTDAPVYVLERQSAHGENAPYDFTVLLQCQADERMHSRLKFLINQFKPLRSKMNLVFLGENGRLDSYCCLDVNAAVMEPGTGRIDTGTALNGMTFLQ